MTDQDNGQSADPQVQVTFESGSLQMSVELGEDPEALGELLSQVVEAAGGRAGIMTTWGESSGGSQTSSYGVEFSGDCPLVRLMETAVCEMTQRGVSLTPEMLVQLEREAQSAGGGKPLAVPVRSHGRSVGLFCLWHNSDDVPSLLHDSPGIYHLHIDKLEIGLQNARLLERLLTERRWLEAVVHHSSDGVCIVDQSGRVVGYNKAMAALSGCPLGEAVGKPSHEAFPLAMEEPGESTALRLAQKELFLHTTTPVEARLLARAGTAVDVEVAGAPLFDRQGQPLGWVMTVRDITRRKEMERLQKLFLSAVSHELHTPIAIIKGFAGLLSDPEVELSPEVAREKAAVIVEESDRLERMVGQMLYATRIQAGGIKLNRDTVDLRSLLERVAMKMEPMVKSGGSSLNLELPTELPPALADAEKIQQVVTNLIENALKYGGKAPIRVVAARAGSEVVVRVIDAGPGIPSSARERLFTPFERGDHPLQSRVRGAGLGLFISKSIIEGHGGRIGLEEGDAGGACFYFTLPVELDEH